MSSFAQIHPDKLFPLFDACAKRLRKLEEEYAARSERDPEFTGSTHQTREWHAVQLCEKLRRLSDLSVKGIVFVSTEDLDLISG